MQIIQTARRAQQVPPVHLGYGCGPWVAIPEGLELPPEGQLELVLQLDLLLLTLVAVSRQPPVQLEAVRSLAPPFLEEVGQVVVALLLEMLLLLVVSEVRGRGHAAPSRRRAHQALLLLTAAMAAR